MGMMLRRHNRTPDYAPMVNGKPVKKEPKNRSLTENKQNANAQSGAPTNTIKK